MGFDIYNNEHVYNLSDTIKDLKRKLNLAFEQLHEEKPDLAKRQELLKEIMELQAEILEVKKLLDDVKTLLKSFKEKQ